MKIDVSPRHSGKTSRMIQWLEGARSRVLLVFSASEARRLQMLNEQVRNQIYFWQDYLHNKRKGMPPHEIAIDQADFVLNGLIGQPINRISINAEEDL